MLRFFGLSILLFSVSFSLFSETLKHSETEILDRPLIERYILDELKLLRQDLDQ
jgi:DNA gyrase inhibitor GyrI